MSQAALPQVRTYDMSRTSTIRASSITYSVGVGHIPARTGSLVPNVNRSGKLHHLLRRSRAHPSADRESRPGRQPLGQVPAWSYCPKRQPLGQAPSPGQCSDRSDDTRESQTSTAWASSITASSRSHGRRRMRVPNVNRLGKFHHPKATSPFGSLSTSPKRQPLGQAPSPWSAATYLPFLACPKRQPLGQAPSRAEWLAHDQTFMRPKRQPLGQAPSPQRNRR